MSVTASIIFFSIIAGAMTAGVAGFLWLVAQSIKHEDQREPL
jgi:hypothetical protein